MASAWQAVDCARSCCSCLYSWTGDAVFTGLIEESEVSGQKSASLRVCMAESVKIATVL